MPKTEKTLFQVRLSEDEKRFIKVLAAGQGMTHQQALVAAFTAWAEKLKVVASPSGPPPAHATGSQSEGGNATAKSQTAPPRSATWLQKAAKLDWTKCAEVEVLHGKDRRLWVVRGTLAPLSELLQSVAGGYPVEEVAEVFGVELPQLTRLLEFAGVAKR